MTAPISNQFTKEAIKARMIENATNLWDVKNPLALDPFVRLLIEAFSIEVAKAANEAQIVEGRILDKIARLLTPSLLTMPHTAHAIMHATPTETSHVLYPLSHFYAEKRIANSASGMMTETVEVHFTPVDTVCLTKGNIAYWAVGRQLFGTDESGNKTPLIRTAGALPWATCLIGVELDEAVENFKDISVYFDFPSYSTLPWVYHLLPLCQVSFEEKPVTVTSGCYYVNREGETANDGIFSDYDLMEKLAREVKNNYEHKFVTLGNCSTANADGQAMHPLLLENFDNGLLQAKVTKKVKWLQVTFPPNYDYELLENMYVAINAFPVMNRLLLSGTYGYKTLNNILPLRTTGQQRFMTVHRLTDTHGRAFSEIPFNRGELSKKGYYSLRHGGAERFDQRTAQDLISYLLELTRDEVAAFSSLKQDHIVTILQELSVQIQRLHGKAEKAEVDIKQVPTYIVLEPYDEGDTMDALYWVTLAAQANGIRNGTRFSIRNYPDIDTKTIFLLIDSTGGRDQLRAGERLDAYKHVLLSRDRLVTNEDIRNFCRYELGGILESVKFKQGLAPSEHPKQGYVRTLDVVLVPRPLQTVDGAQWAYLAKTLLTKIKSRTPDGINYRVVVEQL